MATGSWLLTAAGVAAIAGGALTALLGLALIAILFSGRGVPVGGAGVFLVVTTLAGPLALAAGVTVVVAGVRLMNGQAWARTALEIFSWTVLLGSLAYLGYSGIRQREMEMGHVVRGALFFLFTGGPSIAMVCLLRSDSIRRALVP